MIKMALLLVSFFHQKGFFSSRRWWEGEGERTKKNETKENRFDQWLLVAMATPAAQNRGDGDSPSAVVSVLSLH